MQIRDRIKEFRRVASRLLRPNPRNWRLHPDRQREALRGILAEVGIADALLVRELDDGSYQLIDGHLRAESLPEQEVPVLILDVSEEEADKLLLTHDAITGLADWDESVFRSLSNDLDFVSPSIREMLEGMMRTSGDSLIDDEPEDKKNDDKRDVEIPELYQIKITCDNVGQQEELYERLTAEGLRCELMNL